MKPVEWRSPHPEKRRITQIPAVVARQARRLAASATGNLSSGYVGSSMTTHPIAENPGPRMAGIDPASIPDDLAADEREHDIERLGVERMPPGPAEFGQKGFLELGIRCGQELVAVRDAGGMDGGVEVG
jgi:hypothetical protein